MSKHTTNITHSLKTKTHSVENTNVQIISGDKKRQTMKNPPKKKETVNVLYVMYGWNVYNRWQLAIFFHLMVI